MWDGALNFMNSASRARALAKSKGLASKVTEIDELVEQGAEFYKQPVPDFMGKYKMLNDIYRNRVDHITINGYRFTDGEWADIMKGFVDDILKFDENLENRIL